MMALATTLTTWVGAGMAVLVAGIHWIYRISPRLSHPGIFFAVTVPPDFAASAEAKEILRAYDRKMAWHTVIGVALCGLSMLSGPVVLRWVLMIGGFIWQAVGNFIAFQQGRRAAMRYQVREPVVREAPLVPRRAVVPGGWITQVAPLIVILGTIVALGACWHRIPAVFPTHWGFAGRPDAWANKSLATVFISPIMAAVLWGSFALFLGRFATGVRRMRPTGESGAKEQRFLRLTTCLIVTIEYFLVLLIAALSLLPLGNERLWNHLPWWWLAVMDAVIVTGALAVMIRAGQGGWKLPVANGSGTDELPGDGTPDACWHWGVFYANPSDPAVFVARRYGAGYTMNYSNRKTWLFMAGMLALLLVSVGMALLLTFTANSPAAR